MIVTCTNYHWKIFLSVEEVIYVIFTKYRSFQFNFDKNCLSTLVQRHCHSEKLMSPLVNSSFRYILIHKRWVWPNKMNGSTCCTLHVRFIWNNLELSRHLRVKIKCNINKPIFFNLYIAFIQFADNDIPIKQYLLFRSTSKMLREYHFDMFHYQYLNLINTKKEF